MNKFTKYILVSRTTKITTNIYNIINSIIPLTIIISSTFGFLLTIFYLSKIKHVELIFSLNSGDFVIIFSYAFIILLSVFVIVLSPTLFDYINNSKEIKETKFQNVLWLMIQTVFNVLIMLFVFYYLMDNDILTNKTKETKNIIIHGFVLLMCSIIFYFCNNALFYGVKREGDNITKLDFFYISTTQPLVLIMSYTIILNIFDGVSLIYLFVLFVAIFLLNKVLYFIRVSFLKRLCVNISLIVIIIPLSLDSPLELFFSSLGKRDKINHIYISFIRGLLKIII